MLPRARMACGFHMPTRRRVAPSPFLIPYTWLFRQPLRESETFICPVCSWLPPRDAATRDWCDTGRLRRSVRFPASAAKHVSRGGCHSHALPAPAQAGAGIHTQPDAGYPLAFPRA
jgi:hypothetical protein